MQIASEEREVTGAGLGRVGGRGLGRVASPMGVCFRIMRVKKKLKGS